MNQMPDFTKMTEKEKLEYIELQLANTDLNANLCRIDEPDCEACQ